jgi:hypothetical protein
MMRRSSLLAVVFALAIPALLAAQSAAGGPPTRTGFWISFGLGGGPKWHSCDVCTEEFGNGFGGSVALGGTLSQQWLIGADVVGFFPFAGMDDGYTANTDGFGAALFTMRHYPKPDGGLFLMGGLGLGEIDVEQDVLEANGFVGKVGLGYDLRAGRNFSITPNVSLVQSFGTETERAGEKIDQTMNFGMVQLGVSWH